MIKTIFTVAATVLLLASCKGEGIFAAIADSTKIVDGSLPEGVSANEGVLFCTGAGSNWAYFSAGPSLMAKDISNSNAKWTKVPLPTGYTNIQSIAASTTDIVFSAVGTVGGNRTTSIFSFEPPAGADPTPSYVANDFWTWTDSTYYSASVYYPGTGTTFYVNGLTFSGEFADNDAVLSGSTLYSTTGGALSTIGALDSTVDAASDYWLVTGAATRGVVPVTRLSLMSEDSESGILIDESAGSSLSPNFTNPGHATLPFTGISWLDDAGAFFMGTCLTGRSNIGNIFVSTNGNDWWRVGGIDEDDMYISFIDVSGVPGSGLILAGRDLQGEDPGYEHINVTGILDNFEDDGVWLVSTDKFSDDSSYNSTDMDDASVTGFTIIHSATSPLTVDTLFASTRGAGIYSIDASTTGNEWVEE